MSLSARRPLEDTLTSSPSSSSIAERTERKKRLKQKGLIVKETISWRSHGNTSRAAAAKYRRRCAL